MPAAHSIKSAKVKRAININEWRATLLLHPPSKTRVFRLFFYHLILFYSFSEAAGGDTDRAQDSSDTFTRLPIFYVLKRKHEKDEHTAMESKALARFMLRHGRRARCGTERNVYNAEQKIGKK